MKKTNTQTEALTQAQVILLENGVIDRSRHPDRFRLINNQYNALQSWHDQHTGWRIRRSPASIRLIRTPVSFIPGYVFQTLQHPRDFACFVWTLWYAETRLSEGGGHSNGQQFLMSHLAERLEEHSATGYLAPHVAPLDFKRQSDRYSLSRALKTLQELGGLYLEDGSSEEWLNQAGQENALWEFSEITRSLILALDMEQVRLAARTLQGNPKALTPARLPGAEKIIPLQRAWRTLLLGPVLLKYDDPEAFEALCEHQETFNFELGQTYGWQLDLRYEYAMIVRPSGTGLGPFSLLNLTGAADQAALLCCEVIRQKVSGGEWQYPASEGCRVLPESEIAEVFRQVREEYGSRWGSTARKMSFQELLQDVYDTLRQAGLMRGPDRSGNVLLLPTMARFGVSYPPPPEEEIGPPPLVIEKPQQMTFEGTDTSSTPLNKKPDRNGKAAAQPGYNAAQAGRILGVSNQSILNWLNTGFLKGERQPHGWVIQEAEVERLKEIRWGTAPTPPSSPKAAQPENARVRVVAKESSPAIVNSDEPGYNATDAGRLLGVTEVTILNWLKKDKIKGEKIGLNWSIPPAEIERIKNSWS